MDKFSYIFLGSTKYSNDVLQFLVSHGFVPEAIFTIPELFNISYSNKRVKNTNWCDLSVIAEKYNIPIYWVDSIEGKRLKDYITDIKCIKPDLILALGWYFIIPDSIRHAAKYGAWGIHASLLPKYAGNAPLVWAIINGEKETGITLFRMSSGTDDGDIITQEKFDINFKDNIKTVYDKATTASKKILLNVFKNNLKVNFTPQNKSSIELYPARTPSDGNINWNQSSLAIYNFIRAQTLPYPCAFSIVNNKIISIYESDIVNKNNTLYVPGSIVSINNTILVATTDKFISLGVINDGDIEQKFDEYSRINNLLGCSFEM